MNAWMRLDAPAYRVPHDDHHAQYDVEMILGILPQQDPPVAGRGP
jgi:hypothetical protein